MYNSCLWLNQSTHLLFDVLGNDLELTLAEDDLVRDMAISVHVFDRFKRLGELVVFFESFWGPLTYELPNHILVSLSKIVQGVELMWSLLYCDGSKSEAVPLLRGQVIEIMHPFDALFLLNHVLEEEVLAEG